MKMTLMVTKITFKTNLLSIQSLASSCVWVSFDISAIYPDPSYHDNLPQYLELQTTSKKSTA